MARRRFIPAELDRQTAADHHSVPPVIRSSSHTPPHEMQTTNRPQTSYEIEAEKRQRENDQRWPMASSDREVRRQAIADFMRKKAAVKSNSNI